MGNARTISTAQKHRHRRQAAKQKLQLHLDGKLKTEELPELAKRYLTRRLRVAKKS